MNAGKLVSKVTTGDQCREWCELKVCHKGRGDSSDGGYDGFQSVGPKTSIRRVSKVNLSSEKAKCPCCFLLSLQSCEHGVSNRQTKFDSKASLGRSYYSQEDRRRALTDMPCENNEAWTSNLAFRLLDRVRDSNFVENVAPPSPSSRLQSPKSPASLASQRSWFSSSLWSDDDVLFSSLNKSLPSLGVDKVTSATLPSRSSTRLPLRASLMLPSVKLSYLLPDAHCGSSMLHSLLISTGVVDVLSNFTAGNSWDVSNHSPLTTPALQNTPPSPQTNLSYTLRRQTATNLPPSTRCKAAKQRVKESNKYPSAARLSPDHQTVRTRSTQRDIPAGSRKSCVSSAAAQTVTRARTRCWSKHFLTSAVLMVVVFAAATTAYELKRE